MKKYFQYLSYVLRHKWYVFLECSKRGYIWLGIIHDWSKFLPSEWFPYMNHFYGPQAKRGIKEGRDETGYYKPTDTGDKGFDFAWLLHQKRNRHHWQWWILPEDSGGVLVLEMDEKYRIEMMCDWRGAARAQNVGTKKDDYLVNQWYVKNSSKLQLHPKTRKLIQRDLGLNGNTL